MFERETGDFDPELEQAIPRSAAEEAGPPAGPPHPASGPPHAQAHPSASPGNRPADNARRVDSAGQVGGIWQGAEGATDFLGLDQEVFGVDAFDFAPEAPPSENRRAGAGVPAPLAGAGHESWLLDLDDASAEGVGADTLDPDLDLPEPLDASFAEPDRGGRFGTWAVRGVAAAAVLAVCVTLVRLYSAGGGEPSEPAVPVEPAPRRIAREPELSLPGAGPAAVTLPNGAASAAGEDTVAVSRESFGGAAALDPGASGERAIAGDPELRGTAAVEAFERAMRERAGEGAVAEDVEPAPPIDPDAARAGDPLDGGRHPFGDVALETPGGATEITGAGDTLGVGPVVRVGELPPAAAASPGGGLRYATAEDLAGMWEGATIPFESLDASVRLVTPNIGRVRAVLESGEVFEGRMYGIGQGKVWLDTELGRMALEGDGLAKVEHIITPEGSAALGTPGSQKYAGLPRVRARVPGGVFFGLLIHEEDGRATLITEEGARITLEDAEIEPAPTTKRVVVKGYESDLEKR